MLLNIHHEILYRYSSPVDYTIQNLRLTPRQETNQQAFNWKIDAPGICQRQKDAYGNFGHILVLDQPHEEIRITVTGEVQISDENAYFPSDGGEVPLLAFVQPTQLTTANKAVLELAASAHHTRVGKSNTGSIDAMFALIHQLHKSVVYLPSEGNRCSTAADVLAAGAGMSQDYAHLFIACCRALDLPSRYVSGYIYSGNTDRASSHAWADIWLDSLGWVSFDVVNGNFAAAEHCRLAVGRDYLDACPVRRVRHGGGEEAMEAAVQIASTDKKKVMLQSMMVEKPISREYLKLVSSAQ